MAVIEVAEDPRKDMGLDKKEKAERILDQERLFSKVFALELSENASSELSDPKRLEDLKEGNTSILKCEPKHVMEPVSSVNARKSEADKDALFLEGRDRENAERREARQRFEDLKGLDEKLRAQHITTGKLLGLGIMGVVFELKNSDTGAIIDSAVLRIDPAEANGTINNPAATTPLYRDINGYYEASIMAKAKDMDPELAEAEKHALIAQSLAVLNSSNRGERTEDKDGKLPHITDLDFLKDLRTDQFMKFEGVDLPVLTDISSMSNVPMTDMMAVLSMGNIDSFIDTSIEAGYAGGAKTRMAVADPAVVEKMTEQVARLRANVRAEIESKGIILPPPGTALTSAHGTEIGAEPIAEKTRI